MKIEELHEILKKSHKKHVGPIHPYEGCIDLGPDYPPHKEFYIVKNDLTIIITQIDKKECFEFWVQNDDEGEGCTISTKMKGSKVIDLVNLIM